MKKIFTLMMLIAVAVIARAAKSNPDFVVNDVAYKIITGSTNCQVWHLSSGTYTGDIVIPSTVSNGGTTYTVTTIGEAAFEESGITSITIPETVTTIDEDAFRKCDKLTTFTVGKNITTLGRDGNVGYVFERCTALTAITVEAGNANYTDIDGVLFSKDKKTMYAYPGGKAGTDYTTPDGVETIAVKAFTYVNNLTNVVIGSSVKTIKAPLFRSCDNLQTATVNGGEEIKFSGSGEFVQSCSNFKKLTIGTNVTAENILNIISTNYSGYEIVISDDNKNVTTDDGFLFDKSKTTLLTALSYTGTSYTTPAGITTIADGAFSRCETLTSLTLGNDVTTIESGSLYAPNLETLIIGDGITILPESGLSVSPRLKNLVIGNGITAIGENFFSGLPELQELTIGSQVTTIGNGAFTGLPQLKSITNLSTIPQPIEGMVFARNYAQEALGLTQNSGSRRVIFDGNYDQYTLHVKEGCKAAYQADPFWGQFTNIMEDAATGINTAAYHSTTEKGRYTLSGQRSNGQRGITIVQMSDGTTRKIIVK